MKLRKMLAVLSALCMMCAVVPVLPVQETAVISASTEGEEDPEYTYENFKYKKYADYVQITGYVEEPSGELIIPAEIDGLPVTSIKSYAFSNCEKITSVTFPDTITMMATGVFYYTGITKQISAFKTVSYVAAMAFYNCTGIKEINVSDTHPTLSSEDGVLFNKDKTTLLCYPIAKTEESYVFPESVTNIGANAFSGCSSLKSIIIPDSVTSIGYGAFSACSSLTTVTIPENITNVNRYTFSDTPWMEEKIKKAEQENQHIIIGSTFVFVGGSTTVSDFIIPDGVTTIGNGAFQGCIGLTSVVIPDSVISIEDYAFAGCAGLTSVTIPESVTSIGSMAFGGKSKSPFMLTSVIIKNPDCEIYDFDLTFSHTATIYGYENSTAQAYAEKYGYQFELIGSEPDTTETKELESGDADGSGKIDILDVITINKAILGKEKLSDEQLKAVDFNGNGKPDAGDSLILMKYIAGLIDTIG